ncbi:MAG TPA: ABC transporter permease, partial [Pirellulales bacterium]
RMSKVSIRRLLAGQAGSAGQLIAARTWLSQTVGWLSLTSAIGTAALANGLTGEAQAGAFVGSGALVLTALLAFVWSRLRGGSGPLIRPGGKGVVRLALRNAARNPGRSTLTIGLVAAASFLIIALSAFRLGPAESTANRDGGSGGFSLMADSDQPLYQDLGAAAGREELGLSANDSQLLADDTMVSLRVKPGDDASCLNLYQPTEPRVLGVPDEMIERGGFAWSATAATTAEEEKNPWRLLDRPLADGADGEKHVPVILDANTAAYSLHLGGVGKTITVSDGRGGRLVLEVVGLLKNSIFQGDLLISEKAFLAHFPEISGYRFFLIDAPPEETAQIESLLERTLGDAGFDVQSTRRRLIELMAVQNTYLSTFQSLGGLGLLLGTFGLAVVQLRNVLERRGEMALMRATGFRRGLLGRMVLLENAALLVAGLAVGVGAALVAVWPHLWRGGASLPWMSLTVTMALVLITGLLAGLLALRAALVAPLLPALRGD